MNTTTQKSYKKKASLWEFTKGLVLTGLLIYFTLVVLGLIYHFTFGRHRAMLFGFVGIWLFLSYVTIPRIHRRLTKLYLPDYYIGRTRTGDGLLGDPINLAFFGKKRDIIKAMEAAGWIRADELNAKSTYRMIKYSLLKKSYPSAPVSSLFLFGRKQDFAFQQEVGGTTSKRHHIRFWKSPRGWFLPGGFKSDWLAAATFDRKVGISTFTFQITHKIEMDIDTERDFVISSIKKASKQVKVEVIENFASGYHDRNGGGDFIETDGAMPFVHIN